MGILLFLKITTSEEQLFSGSSFQIHIFNIISDVVCFGCLENLEIIIFRIFYLRYSTLLSGEWASI